MTRRTMTREEFEQGYAERSGMAVEKLRSYGQHVEPCDCDYEGCQGWQMVSPSNIPAEYRDLMDSKVKP